MERGSATSGDPVAQELVEAEVREAVGPEPDQQTVERAAAVALEGSDDASATSKASDRLLMRISLATAVVVGVIVGLATGSWVFFALALVAHSVGFYLVAATAFKRMNRHEELDPRRTAQLEDRGVRDPGGAVDAAVREVREG